MRKPRVALRWIVTMLRRNRVPFQVTGGLAARAYGATRPLADIDLTIPEKSLFQYAHQWNDYIVFGPGRYRDSHWDLSLVTLEFQGQAIDLGSDQARIFDRHCGKWRAWRSDFSQFDTRMVLGLVLPVEPLQRLVAYKDLLGRECDLKDIAELTKRYPALSPGTSSD